MSLVEVIIRLCAISLLVGYLYVRSRRQAPSRPTERHSPGHGIVITSVSERVQRVRHDYVSALSPRPNQICERLGMLASARRAVARLPYFQSLESQRSAQTKHELQTQADG